MVSFYLLLFSHDILLVGGTCNFMIAKLQGIRNNVHSDCEREREYACISKHCVEGKEPKEYVIMGHSDYYFAK